MHLITTWFLAKFHQVVSPLRVVQHPFVKFGDFLLSTLSYCNIVKTRASHHYDHTKGRKCKGVKPILSKVIEIHFVTCRCRQLSTSHPPPSPSLHFLKPTTYHLSLPYVNSITIHACFPSLLITYISMIKLIGLVNNSYLIVEDHHYFIMHHNIKDRYLFVPRMLLSLGYGLCMKGMALFMFLFTNCWQGVV